MCQVNAADVLRWFLLFDVAVVHFRGVTELLQCFLQRFSQHHRAMLATSTAEGNRQITLSLGNIMRDQIGQQALDSLQELSRLRIRKNESPDLRIPSCKSSEPRHKMWIRQKPHVEHQIAVARQPVLVPKTYQ